LKEEEENIKAKERKREMKEEKDEEKRKTGRKATFRFQTDSRHHMRARVYSEMHLVS
jgi:hypothetical protein